MKTFIIGINDAGQRVDKFIRKAAPRMPESLLQKAIREKKIKLNRKRCSPQTFLCESDVLDIYLHDDVFLKNEIAIKSSNFKPCIAYQDENILIADKPGGVLTHGENSLHNAVIEELIENGEYNSRVEQSFTPAPCNRLDRNTCGLVIFAKNANALRKIDEAIANREITKIYRCLVTSAPVKAEDTIICYLKKDNKQNCVTVSDIPKDGYKQAITKYKNIGKNQLEIELITGRTHQIRASLAHIGSPVIGDTKYGAAKGKLRLCAYQLRFNITGEFSYLNNLVITSKLSF